MAQSLLVLVQKHRDALSAKIRRLDMHEVAGF